MGHFLDWELMCKGPAQPPVSSGSPGQVVLAFVKKQAE